MYLHHEKMEAFRMEAVLQTFFHVPRNKVHRFSIQRRESQVIEIPAEADRVLQIWANWKKHETNTYGRGLPKESTGFTGRGYYYGETFDELVERADRRTGAISDAILDEMGRTGYHRQQLAIWNKYLGDTARFCGDCEQILDEACRMFLIEAKRRGIAV